MRDKIFAFIVSLAVVFGSLYLAFYLGLTDNSLFFTDVISRSSSIGVSVTVPPSAVIFADNSQASDSSSNSNSGGGGVAISSGGNNSSSSSAGSVDSVRESTVVTSTAETENVSSEAAPVEPAPPAPTAENDSPPEENVITVKPVVEENKKITVEVDDSLVLEEKTLEPFVEPEAVKDYLEPFFPNIVISDAATNDDGSSSLITKQPKKPKKILNNIVALNVDQVTKEEDIDLYANKPIIFKGKTEPFAKVEVSLHSKLQTDVVFADSEGNWFWSPPKPVESGDHTFAAIFKNQATGTKVGETKLYIAVIPPPAKDKNAVPIHMSLTPGYQRVSGDKPFVLNVNFDIYNDQVQYPVKLDYKIFNIFGDLYGSGTAYANPDGGSIVRLPIQLESATAGVYRVNVSTNVLGQDVEADALFDVLQSFEAEIVEQDLEETERQNNIFMMQLLLVALGLAAIIYGYLKARR